MENYYKILKVHPKASQAEIRERFRFLASAYHPDKFPTPTHKAQAEAEFKKINEAYQVLSVPLKRAEYDRRIQLAQSSWVENERNQSSRNPANPNRASNIGRWLISTIGIPLLFYLAIFIFTRMGPGGLILVLILVGIISLKFYWR